MVHFVFQDGHEICFVGDEAFRELSQVDPQADKLLDEVGAHIMMMQSCNGNSMTVTLHKSTLLGSLIFFYSSHEIYKLYFVIRVPVHCVFVFNVKLAHRNQCLTFYGIFKLLPLFQGIAADKSDEWFAKKGKTKASS